MRSRSMLLISFVWIMFVKAVVYSQTPELVVNKGHSAEVTSVAFSPDGRYLVTGSQDKTVKLWDAATGKELRTFDGYSNDVYSVAFSPDGRYVVTGSSDTTAKLWEAATGKELRTFGGHSDWVSSVAFSPDGRYVVTGSQDRTAKLWEAGTGKELRTFGGHSSSGYSVAFSPDGRYVVTGSSDKTAKLWEAATGKELRTFGGHSSLVTSVAFSPDGRHLVTITGHVLTRRSNIGVTGSGDNTAKLWEAATGKELRTFGGHSDWVQSVAFSPDGRYVVTGSWDKTAKLWEAATGKELRTFRGHSGSVLSVAFGPDSRHVVTGSDDNTAKLWEAATGKELRTYGGHSSSVTSVAFSPDGRYVVTGRHNTAKLWEAATGKELRTFAGHSDNVRSVAFSRDGRYVVTGSQDRTAKLWEIATGKELRTFAGHSNWVYSVAFSPDGRYVVTGSSDSTAKLWEAATGKELLAGHGIRTFSGWYSDTVYSVAFSPDGRYVVTGSGDATTKIWDSASGTLLCTLISVDQEDWVVVAPDGRFDTSNLEEMKSLHWLMPDGPFYALRPEIFVRDYYEPRLLPRVLAGGKEAFKAIRPLDKLNRVQPDVKILGVRRGASAEVALVDVEVAEKEDLSQRNGKTKTAVYDVRLYRGGQLVGQWPEPKPGNVGQEDIETWRTATRVTIPAGANKLVHTFAVQLASRDKGKPVLFTAYAFNEDRVKSETAVNDRYKVPDDIVPRKPRAYVLTIGVNAYENPKRNLSFAVKDAKDVVASLRQIRGYEVVPVSLVSESAPSQNSPSIPPVDQATKVNIRSALGLLAGESTERSGLQGVANADKLTKATPDDLVILAFSGHGHTTRDGRFYLLPSDSGAGEINDAVKSKLISSEDLTEWLRGVDAGEMAMVIDACHSAASVEVPGFKPGPMGDRGLGQLAYDKGMRILAATQADDVALESEKLGQGLLTYALVQEGLGIKDKTKTLADLNSDGTITLLEWLQYGEKRVPGLYEDVKTGKLRFVSRDTVTDPEFITKAARLAQTPSLFDFNKRNDGVIVGP